MRSSYLVVFIICVFFLFLQFCGNDEKSPAGLDDPFIDELRITLPEIETIPEIYTLSPPVLSPLRVLAIPDSDLLIVADAAGWSVRLFDQHGVEHSKVGGEGRGPGEFEVINQLLIDHDRRLYVLDLRLTRLNMFDIDIESKELVYVTTIVFEHTSNLRLREIYITEEKYYGVFNQTNDYQTGANSYHLYGVDEAFRPEEHLLEIPGNEKIVVEPFFFSITR